MPAQTTPQDVALQSLLDSLRPNLALALSEQVNREVTFDQPIIETLLAATIMSAGEPGVFTTFSLSPPRDADSVFSLDDDTARMLADLIAGGDGQEAPEELDETALAGLQTAMAGLVRGLAIALANLIGGAVEVESCATQSGPVALPPSFAMSAELISVRLPMHIDDVTDTEIALYLPPALALALPPDAPEPAPTNGNDSVMSEDELAAMLSNMGGDGGFVTQHPKSLGGGFGGVGSSATPPPFANFPTGDLTLPRGMDLILDIPLEVTVELGRVRMLIKDVLELSSGSIIELDRVAGEPVDLLVNGRLIAKGEVVVIEDNFGVRLTEIISPAERVSGLGKGR